MRTHHPSANSTLTCCYPHRTTCIALHPCSGAEARLSPLLGRHSSKAEDICCLLRGIGWRDREEWTPAKTPSYQDVSKQLVLVLWADLPTAAPSVLVWWPIWLLPALLPRLATHQWGPRALCWESSSLKGFCWIQQDYSAGTSEEALCTSLISTIHFIYFFSVFLGPTWGSNNSHASANAGPNLRPAL